MRRRWVAAGLGAGRTKMARTGIATLALVASAAPIGAARADESSGGVSHTYVVHGTVMPLGMQFSFVGCDNLVQRTAEPIQPTVALGPGTAPMGTRSLGYSLHGGNALGSLVYAQAVGSTTASIAVYPDAAGTDPHDGVAYVGYHAPHQASDRMWIGRAELTDAVGQWTTVDASTLEFDWSEVAVASGLPVTTSTTEATSQTVGDFTAQHGDGPGFFTIGFGCNGAPFNIDALRAGNSVYDLEGLETHVSISGSASIVHAGQTVTLTGALRDSTGARVPGGVLVLEERHAGGAWTPIRVVDASAADPRVTVKPSGTTEYRFRSLDRALAPAAESATFSVAAPSSTPKPSASPTSQPSASPSATASASAGAPVAPKSSPKSSAPASTQSPSTKAAATPGSGAASAPANASATPSPAASPSASATSSAASSPAAKAPEATASADASLG